MVALVVPAGGCYNLLISSLLSFAVCLVADHERIALGNEEGLFVVHVTKDGKTDWDAVTPSKLQVPIL